MKKLFFTLMLLVTVTATMSAQDEPIEQTAKPYINLESIPSYYYDDNYYHESYYYLVTIFNSEEDPDADLFYRYSHNEGEFTEWMPYYGEIIFDCEGNYRLEAYAKAEGKSASDITDIAFTIFEPTPSHIYDFVTDGFYYKRVSDRTLRVTYKSDEWVAYPYANGQETYSGYVEIPDTVYRGTIYTVTHVGNLAFWQCDVTGVTLPNTITTIETQAFMECTLDSIYIPASVTSIEPGAFGGCNQLVSIQVDENNPVYDSRENCNAIIETATNTMVCATLGTVIPSSVTAIGELCFGNYPDGLHISSIVIPDQVVSIGAQAFMFCCNLQDVTIGSSVASIGERAFNFTGIENLVLPASVATISEHAFSYSFNLKSVVCKAIIPPVAENVFDGNQYSDDDQDKVYHEATLFVPNESIEAYRAHEEWGKFTHIVPFIGAGPGDVNGDGNIAINDVTNLIDLLLGSDEFPAWADVNGDGNVTIADVTALIDMLLSGN